MPPRSATRLKSLPKRKAEFIEPMDCAPVPKLRDGSQWVFEIKLDGYRAIAVKTDERVNLFSRRYKSFNHQYPHLVGALAELPESTVVDGEVVALDESGRPNFNLLQNFRSESHHIHYFIFDLLVCNDRDLTKLPLIERRRLMKSLLKLRSSQVRIAEQFEASANDMLAAVRQQQLEGVIGKRKDGFYEPGKRSGSWIKYRVNRGQELVIGGYIPGPHGFDSLIVGYYQGKDLMYVANFDPGTIKEFDGAKLEKDFDAMLNTFRFTGPVVDGPAWRVYHNAGVGKTFEYPDRDTVVESIEYSAERQSSNEITDSAYFSDNGLNYFVSTKVDLRDRDALDAWLKSSGYPDLSKARELRHSKLFTEYKAHKYWYIYGQNTLYILGASDQQHNAVAPPDNAVFRHFLHSFKPD